MMTRMLVESDRSSAPLVLAAGASVALLFSLVGCSEVSPSVATDSSNPVSSDTVEYQLPVIVFEPASPTSRDDVIAIVANAVPGVNYVFSWERDDGTVGPAESLLLASATERGDRWTVTVAPVSETSSGSDDVLSGARTVLIGNSEPRCQRVELAPTAAAVPRWTCACAERDEPDPADSKGESDTCEWALNGTSLPEGVADAGGCSLDAPDLSRGDQLRCVLTPTDGQTLGPSTSSPMLAIGNGAPDIGAATVAPESPRDLDLVRCEVAGAIDPDGDPLTWTVRWVVGGDVVLEGTAPNANELLLGGNRFDEGDTIRCEAMAHDETRSSGLALSSTVTAVNSLPVAEGAELSPIEGRRDDLVGLKENVILGKLIPAGTGFRGGTSDNYEGVILATAEAPEQWISRAGISGAGAGAAWRSPAQAGPESETGEFAARG